jgi:hypothetical protein
MGGEDIACTASIIYSLICSADVITLSSELGSRTVLEGDTSGEEELFSGKNREITSPFNISQSSTQPVLATWRSREFSSLAIHAEYLGM